MPVRRRGDPAPGLVLVLATAGDANPLLPLRSAPVPALVPEKGEAMKAAWVANMLAMELTVGEQRGGGEVSPAVLCLEAVRSRRTLALKQGRARASVATVRVLAGSFEDVDWSERMCSRETYDSGREENK